MSADKPRYRFFRYALVAVLCALPFFLGSVYLYKYVERVDTLPLEVYEGLRWMPDGKSLTFLHHPLQQEPPADTEVWKVSGMGTDFHQIATLPASRAWTLTRRHAGSWMLARGRRDGEATRLALVQEGHPVKVLEVESGWKLLPSQGDGLFFQTLDEDLPFDQFVDVEEAPEMKPELEEFEEPPELSSPPTRSGLKIARYNVETDALEPLFSIPYNRPEEQPIVQLVRSSPDGRFLALVVRFGESSSAGLWVHDGETRRLLWTRVGLGRDVRGIDWSSDSVRVAVTDGEGLSILQNALGIESVRLEVTSTDPLRPKWGAGSRLYLINDHVVYQVEEDRNQAQPLFDSRSQSEGFSDLVLDPVEARVAYSASPRGYRELFVRDLRTGQTEVREAYPGSVKQKAQGTVAYQLGNAIRFAWRQWTR